jgi:hypothetical protein
MQVPIGGEGKREVIIVGAGGTTYDHIFGEAIAVRPIGDTATFEQHITSHDDPRRIGAILLGGVFAEPNGEPDEQWSSVLDVLERVEAGREGERIPVTPFSDIAPLNLRIRDRLEEMGQPILIQSEGMLYAKLNRIAEWVAGELNASPR